MPDAPTLIEQGVPGFETRVWMGLFAPAGTPADVIAKLHQATMKAAATPEFATKLAASASVPWTGTPEDLRKFLVADIQRWSVIVQAAGVTAD